MKRPCRKIRYIFKHALTQEVAYDSLLKQRHQKNTTLPCRIGWMHYELVAHHYERHGNAEKAVHYLILAGEKSNRHGAVQVGCEFL